MCRILQIVPTLELGGIGMMLYNYYKFINCKQNSKIHFDFVVFGEKKYELEYEFERMGSKIFHVTPKSQNFYKYINEMKSIFNRHYDIVHAHQNAMSFIPLAIAKKVGVKIRIAHSHSCILHPNWKEKIIRYITMPLIRLVATDYAYCSDSSKKWVFGESVKNGKLITNGIYLEKFIFQEKKRIEIREKLKLKDKIVIGYIGRLEQEKNLKFQIDLMETLPNDYHLLIIGNGSLKENIEKSIRDKHLENRITLLGSKTNACEYYNVFDYFILPSFFEAFPVTLVESQANGLKSFISKHIPMEVRVTDLIREIDINDMLLCRKQILSENADYERTINTNMQKFSMQYLAGDLVEYYERLMGEIL